MFNTPSDVYASPKTGNTIVLYTYNRHICTLTVPNNTMHPFTGSTLGFANGPLGSVKLSRECCRNAAKVLPNYILVANIGKDTGMSVTLEGIEKANCVLACVECGTNIK